MSSCNSSIPYLALPRIYIPIDFERNMIGTTIIDTILNYLSQNGNTSAIFKTLYGDYEVYPLGIIIGTFVDNNHFGFSGEIPFITGDNLPTLNNGVLEINKDMDKISISYSLSNNEVFSYSIIYTDSLIYYPQRWFDRLP